MNELSEYNKIVIKNIRLAFRNHIRAMLPPPAKELVETLLNHLEAILKLSAEEYKRKRM